jgi:hypothetical protein
MLHIVLEGALEDASTLEDDLPIALLLALVPLALICGIVDRVLPCPMPQPILDLALITAAIWPVIVAPTTDAVISELSRIFNAIDPCKCTLA